MDTRFAVTGIGSISALGHDTVAFQHALSSGTCGIGPIDVVRSEDLHVKIAAQVRGFDATAHFPAMKLAALDPFAQYGLVAAREAVRMSGLTPEQIAGPRTAVIMGTGVGGTTTIDQTLYARYGEGKRRMDAAGIPRTMPNAAVSHITMEFGITGPAFAVCSACSSSNHAVAVALNLLRSGIVDRAITGGSECCVTPSSIGAWEALKVLSPNVVRPFSRGRNGMSLADAAGVVILERRDAAAARSATVFAELAGVGMTSDAGDLLRPDPAGAANAMRLALADAGLAPEDIDYINAHGTGTLLNDVVETAAIRQVFGPHADRLAVSSTKSMHGHALGAAGAIELVATVLAVREQFAPPTVNWLEADPKCDLDYVPNTARPMPIRAALSNSFAFGGLNGVLAVRRPA